MKSQTCNNCSTNLQNQRSINLTLEDGKQVNLCNTCFNEQLESKLDIELDVLHLKSVTVLDADGNDRTFKIERLVVPTGIAYEAYEVTEAEHGYKFAVLAEFDCNQKELVKKLAEKIEIEVSKKYIEEEVFQGGRSRYIKDFDVVGRIESDLDSVDGSVPLIIVDGKTYNWDEFGSLLMQFEGYQFKLRMFDITDDVK